MHGSSVTRLLVVNTQTRESERDWRTALHEALASDSASMFERLDIEALSAIEANDHRFVMAVSAHVLAFMLIDWGRFTKWQTWMERFEGGSAASPKAENATDFELELARVTGQLACALVRSEPIEALTELGHAAPPLLRPARTAHDATQLALAAGVLLPWLQMSHSITGAQVLHAAMTQVWQRWGTSDGATEYFSAAWLFAWAQHIHYTDRPRLPEVRAALKALINGGAPDGFRFKDAALDVEAALHDRDVDGTEREMRRMLNLISAQRPMDSVKYNAIAISAASARKDLDAGREHIDQMNRDLLAADCPPSLASPFRFREVAIHLTVGDFAKAAGVFDACAAVVGGEQARIVNGYAALARALKLHHLGSDDSASFAALREQLALGLAIMRQTQTANFFYAAPVARGALCALALREAIEVEFVRSSLSVVSATPPIWADENWPWLMSLRTFGGFRAQVAWAPGQRTDKASSRPLMLLKLIAAYGAQGVPVTTALDFLWSAQDGDQAEHALTVTLQRLRRMFVEDELILRSDGWLILNSAKVWTDVAALETHIGALPDAAAQTREAEWTRYVKRLFDLYRGDCLFAIDDGWAHDRAAHFRARVMFTVHSVVRHALESGCSATVELALARAIERGLDVTSVFKTVHSYQSVAPSIVALQARIASINPTQTRTAFH